MTELARRTLLWLATIAIGVGCGATNPPHASVDPPPPVGNLRRLDVPEAGRAYHGVLPAGTTEPDSDVSPRALDGYEQTVGRKVAYVYFSTDWFRSLPSTTAGWIRDRGSVPFIRLMMRSQRQPLVTDPTFTLDRIIAGEFDRDLSAWADAARQFATPLAVEYGTEVNGDLNPWSAPYNGGLDVGRESSSRRTASSRSCGVEERATSPGRSITTRRTIPRTRGTSPPRITRATTWWIG